MISLKDITPISLDEINRIKSNIQAMADNNAPHEDIDAYVESEGIPLDVLNIAENTKDTRVGTARGLIKGLATPVTLPQDLFYLAENYLTNKNFTPPLGSENLEKYLLKPLIGETNSGYGRTAEDLSNLTSGGAVLGGLRGAASGLTSASAGSYVRENGGSPIEQMIAYLAGGSVPGFLKTAGNAINSTGHALIDPFTKSGSEKIASKLVKNTVSNPEEVINKIDNPQSYVPGSVPTIAERTLSDPISAMDSAARKIDPLGFKQIDDSNQIARLNYLENSGYGKYADALLEKYPGKFEKELSSPVPSRADIIRQGAELRAGPIREKAFANWENNKALPDVEGKNFGADKIENLINKANYGVYPYRPDINTPVVYTGNHTVMASTINKPNIVGVSSTGTKEGALQDLYDQAKKQIGVKPAVDVNIPRQTAQEILNTPVSNQETTAQAVAAADSYLKNAKNLENPRWAYEAQKGLNTAIDNALPKSDNLTTSNQAKLLAAGVASKVKNSLSNEIARVAPEYSQYLKKSAPIYKMADRQQLLDDIANFAKNPVENAQTSDNFLRATQLRNAMMRNADDITQKLSPNQKAVLGNIEKDLSRSASVSNSKPINQAGAKFEQEIQGIGPVSNMLRLRLGGQGPSAVGRLSEIITPYGKTNTAFAEIMKDPEKFKAALLAEYPTFLSKLKQDVPFQNLFKSGKITERFSPNDVRLMLLKSNQANQGNN